jgi:hypothetical protein
MRIIVLITLIFLSLLAPAQSMTFVVEKGNFGPFGVFWFVYGSGEIIEGDSDRLVRSLQNANRSPSERVFINLDSPGGSLVEGLKLGRTIDALKADTNVGHRSSNQKRLDPGECLSACVIAYLGGNYRELEEQSKLGVHQFAFSKNIAAGEATAVTQLMSAEIVEFIKNSRADTSFFTLMTSALPSEIYFVPHQKLRELRVVTGKIWDETWSFEYVGNTGYLRIWQQSVYGENRLTLICDNKRLFGGAIVEPAANPIGPFTVSVFIDGEMKTIPDNLVVEPPIFNGKFISTAFLVTPEIAGRMLSARSVGAAIQPPNKHFFWGFQIDTEKGRDKLSKMILGCR